MSRNINKQELINKVRELSGLTSDEKSALPELLNEEKVYGLVWENHEEAVEEQLREQLPVFREVPEYRILSEDTGAPHHIIIEAENLHALVALTYTHAGKIDVIYIDPPYNTGNKDFVYNDSYVDAEDGYRHSKWVSFMEKRLKIAKILLSERGIIFISIDDNEQANLKLLCDNIFGAHNIIATFIWKKRQMVDSRTKNGASKDHDYLLCIRKTEEGRIRGKLADMGKYSNPDNDPRGPWMSADMTGLATPEQRPNLHYDLLNPKTGIVYKCPPTGWRYEPSRMASLIENDEVLWPPKRTGRPRRKKFAKDIGSEFTGLSTVLETVYSTQGTRELRDIFDGKELFDFPKPVDYIKLIIEQGSSMNSTILDFFAGSGTTLHATMQLNAEDGGHRQCILVTNNENGICENVTYERNKRVIQGYTTPKGEHVAGLAKNNLRYYKADFISRETNSRNKRNLVKAATDLLCIKENLYEEIKITCNGKTLRKNYARRFADSEKEMIIIYEPAVIKYIVEELKTWGQKESIKIYVFSDGRYAYDDDFKDVIDKVTLCALPDAIYQAYRRVLPQRKKAQQAGTMVDNEEMKEALADAEQYSYKEEKGGES